MIAILQWAGIAMVAVIVLDWARLRIEIAWRQMHEWAWSDVDIDNIREMTR
jgi:hypothetical protein